MRRGFFYDRRRLGRRQVLLALMVMAAIAVLAVTTVATTQMRPLLASLATTRVSNTVTRIVSEAVYEAIAKGELEYDGLVSFDVYGLYRNFVYVFGKIITYAFIFSISALYGSEQW